jgi:protease I
MALEGKKVGILVEEFYQELEVWYPLLRLREAGIKTMTIGAQAGHTYKSKLGYPVKAEEDFGTASPTELDGLVIPGGWAPDYLRRHANCLTLVREMNSLNKVIGAICHAGWVLCSADIVRNRRATCFHSIKDDLIHAGAEYVDEPVVVDGNLVTSRVPDDLPQFCQGLLRKLEGC